MTREPRAPTTSAAPPRGAPATHAGAPDPSPSPAPAAEPERWSIQKIRSDFAEDPIAAAHEAIIQATRDAARISGGDTIVEEPARIYIGSLRLAHAETVSDELRDCANDSADQAVRQVVCAPGRSMADIRIKLAIAMRLLIEDPIEPDPWRTLVLLTVGSAMADSILLSSGDIALPDRAIDPVIDVDHWRQVALDDAAAPAPQDQEGARS